MDEQKQKLLEKIHDQLKKKKDELMTHLPVVHQIEDGIVIRFFSNWEVCVDNKKIRYKKIESDTDEILYNFFLPKGTYLDIKKREYASCITCLSGHLVLEVDDELVVLTAHTKKCLKNDVYQGRVLKDAYIVTQAK